VAEQPTSKKRLVKNPETFRERALKAATQSDQPKATARVRSNVAKPFKLVLRPIGRFLTELFHHQPFRLLGKVLNFIGKIVFPAYFRNSWRELRQVKWPNRTESRQLTFAVLVFAVIFGGLVAIVDFGLDKVFKQVLLK
jgi:preprotein translocase SecE subunit